MSTTMIVGAVPTDDVVLYEKCADCHLFIDDNNAYTDDVPNIARWIHLSRGDEADEAIEGTHDAAPSGMLATLSAWRAYGPEAMRARFTPASEKDA